MTDTAQQLDGPALFASAPIVVGELADVPAPGSPIASQWAQEVSNRVVQRFATKAALDGWAAAAGSMAVTLDTGRLWQRIAGAWVLIGGNRVGFSAVNPGQAWTAGQTFSMNWPQEVFDTDGMGTGAQYVTVPFDGIYSISAFISATSAVTSSALIQIVCNELIVSQSIMLTGFDKIGASVVQPFAVGGTTRLQIVSGPAMTYSGQLRLVRVSP